MTTTFIFVVTELQDDRVVADMHNEDMDLLAEVELEHINHIPEWYIPFLKIGRIIKMVDEELIFEEPSNITLTEIQLKDVERLAEEYNRVLNP